MKMRETWKRFWTLDRHHAAGFTLVELIVVIAILAILAGVAVPAYSAYVTKANKQADISLVNDIEHALTLAGYKGTFANGEAGFIVLSTDAAVNVDADSSLDKALTDTFGASYASALKLKYKNWGDNGMLSSLLASGDPQAAAEEIMNSPYLTGNTVEGLMGEVEALTKAAAGIIGNYLDMEDACEALSGLFGTGEHNAFDEALEGVYGEDYDASKLSDTELANLMVMAAAKDYDTYGGTSDGGSLVTMYAGYVGFACSEEGQKNPTVQAAYKKMQDALQNPPANPAGGYQAYVAAAMEEFYDTVGTVDGGDAFTGWMDTSLESSMNAFGNIMSAANKANITSADLKNASLFTSGEGFSMFSNYVASAQAISQMDADTLAALKAALTDNAVVIIYAQSLIDTAVGDTLPTA